MGTVSSRPEEGAALHLKDQNRCTYHRAMDPSRSLLTRIYTVSIAALTVTNNRRRILLNIAPNAYPANRITARRDIGDDSLVEYIQVSIISVKLRALPNR